MKFSIFNNFCKLSIKKIFLNHVEIIKKFKSLNSAIKYYYIINILVNNANNLIKTFLKHESLRKWNIIQLNKILIKIMFFHFLKVQKTYIE